MTSVGVRERELLRRVAGGRDELPDPLPLPPGTPTPSSVLMDLRRDER